MTKYYKATWPIIIIATVGAVLTGVIGWYVFDSSVQDNINSLIFAHHTVVKSPAPQKK